ncbi:hypothetical protein T03_11383 [Trichinella britovi]|uniref:Uncharacterized protein n=1 Tax=Trichinella britovi TaxID=45882 RepID=A0A0V1C648_TRIBR|nr:hypothetical protein T03_11383 [Trichinella britovi]
MTDCGHNTFYHAFTFHKTANKSVQILDELVHSLGEGLPSVDSAQYARLGKNSLEPDSDIQLKAT